MHRHVRTIRTGGAALLTAGLLTAAGTAGPLTAHAAPGCAAYQLPGVPGGEQAEIIAVSPAGIYGGDALGVDGHWHAVYWTHSGSNLSGGWSIHLVPSPITDDFIGDINTYGQMVGTGSDPTTGAGVGYVYDRTSGSVTLLPGLGGGNDYDRRINDAGVVAGTSADTKGVSHAVTWAPPYTKANILPNAGASRSLSSPDSHTKIGNHATGINNRGQVVGVSFNGGHVANTDEFARNHMWHDALAPVVQPFEWQANGAPHRLPTGSGLGQAWAINDSGLVVGTVADAQTFNARPSAWIDGTNVDMGAPSDSVFGLAYGLSQGGWAAGGYVESDGSTTRAFTWDSTDGFRTLDPPAPYDNSWSHGVSDALREVGGSADDGSALVAVLWQC